MRLAAVKKIENTAVLAEIARKDKNGDVRFVAIEKIKMSLSGEQQRRGL